jgi:SAM-dependent methyltransferase
MKTRASPDNVFDRIAPGWYNFRHWSIFRGELEELAARWQSGKLLNLGCAHGPDFLPFGATFNLYGIDSSIGMLKLAGKYAQKFRFDAHLTLADVTRLPYDDEVFDWAVSVATYHHLREEEAQRAALSELRRVLKPGGEAFITVWNRAQPRFWLSGKTVWVPWHTKGEILLRYYYLFSYPELIKLVRRSGFLVLKSFPERTFRFRIKYFSRNICLLLQKKAQSS